MSRGRCLASLRRAPAPAADGSSESSRRAPAVITRSSQRDVIFGRAMTSGDAFPSDARCPNKHPLKFTTCAPALTAHNISCDVCSKLIPCLAARGACAACDFDVCTVCAGVAGVAGEASSDDSKELQPREVASPGRRESGRSTKGNAMRAYLNQERALKGMPKRPREQPQGLTTNGERSSRTTFKRWTAAEELQLSSLVGDLGENAWAQVAESIEGRSASGIEQHWQVMMGTHRSCEQINSSGRPRYAAKQQQPQQQPQQQQPPMAAESCVEEEEEVPADDGNALDNAEWLPDECVALHQPSHEGQGNVHIFSTVLLEAECVE